MVIFDYIKVLSDKKQLILKIHSVENSGNTLGITKIDVYSPTAFTKDSKTPPKDNGDIYTETLATWNESTHSYEASKQIPISYEKTISVASINYDGPLYFIVVHTTSGIRMMDMAMQSAYSKYITCADTDPYYIAATYDDNLYYNKAINLIKDLGDSCTVNKEFVDFIISQNAFKMAINTGHYKEAIDIFNTTFEKSENNITTHKCGCNGKSTV